MLLKSCLFIFLVSNAMRSGLTVFNSYYGIQTSEYPKRTCHKIDNIRSKGQCLGTCLTTMDRIVMTSHHASIKTCLCCSDITGSDIKGPHWKSYVPRTCKYLLSWNSVWLKNTVMGDSKIPVPRDQVYFPRIVWRII